MISDGKRVDGVLNGGEFAETTPVSLDPSSALQAPSSPAGEKENRAAPDSPLPDLIPVRMLNEFAYCPRLGYLEWVDGEWEDNFETMNGTFGHRRVDRPGNSKADSGKQKPDSPESDSAQATSKKFDANGNGKNDQQLHTRSLMLSAPDEGLVAKLDLLELDGMLATPVDYKRGKAPSVPAGAWEPERVQLCAQGLILRENGFQCDEGVLYFIGSRKRVTIAFDDALVARTRELAGLFREAAVRSEAPPPLVDSPKCPRCSLVGICLPDEVNLLAGLAGNPQTTTALSPSREVEESQLHPRRTAVRKLLPARHNALPFYVQEQGTMLGKSGDRLVVKKKGEVVGERRLMDVSQVSLFGAVMVSAAALRELNCRNIPVCHFSYGGWFHGMTTGLVHKNVELRIRQYAIAADPEASLPIARRLISGKIRNARTLLRRHLPKSEKPRLDRMMEFCRKAERTNSAESLLGLEGMAAKVYFEGLFQMLAERHDFDVSDRNRRPPRDPVNAVLSFAYALLTKELTVVLQAVGLDPMLGVFHRPRYGRPSLALDLAEEYRPLIADSVMLTAFNNGELDSRSFLERAGAVTLTKPGRASLIAAFERRMQTEVKHPLFGYRVSYRRLLEVQARLLSRTILGELAEYPAFCTR